MKLMMLSLALFAFVLNGMAQEGETKTREVASAQVPAPVKATMKAKYPDRKVESWKLKEDTYIAKCEVSGKKCEIRIKADGTWKRTDTRIAKKSAPQQALDYVNSKYPKHEIKWVEKREKPNNTSYRIRVKNEEQKETLKFDENGKPKTKK